MSKQLWVSTAMSTSKTIPITSSVFSTKQKLNRSINKTEKSLPSSTQRKAEVIGNFARKFNLRVAVQNKQGKRNNESSQEEK